MKRLFTEVFIEQLSVKCALDEQSSNRRELIMFVQHVHTIYLSIC